jgi:hypothetical protein
MFEATACGENKQMKPVRQLVVVIASFVGAWMFATLGYLLIGVRMDAAEAAHVALTHLLGTAGADLNQQGAALAWNAVVLTIGFGLRVYAYATVALLAIKPYIDRRVRDVATQHFVRGVVAAGVVEPGDRLQDRSVLN